MTSLEVSFIGELGEDFTGLSRKLFTLFWDVALECFFAGRRELRPRVAPYNMNPSAELWHTLGIIFSHGFVLINYVPYRLSYGTLHYLMSGSIPDSATILSSYLSTLSESDDSMITNALRVNRDTRNFDEHTASRLTDYHKPLRLLFYTKSEKSRKYIKHKKYYGTQSMMKETLKEFNEWYENIPNNLVLYTPYISRGFYFREFRESGASREFNNMRKYLPPIWTHECDLCTPPRSRI